MSILLTILYILNKKSKKRTVLDRLKLKTIILKLILNNIYIPFSKKKFSNKLIASDLLMNNNDNQNF